MKGGDSMKKLLLSMFAVLCLVSMASVASADAGERPVALMDAGERP